MTRRTQTIVMMATGLIFSGAAMAQSQNNRMGNRPGETSPGAMTPGGTGSGQTGVGAGAMRTSSDIAREGSSDRADEQIDQQLRKISQNSKDAGDKLFVLHAGLDNEFEIQLAKAVEQKAQNPQVKQLAQTIQQDHQQAQQQLKQVAQALSVSIPSSLPDDKQQEIKILTSLPTDQLEKQYVSMMESDHAGDVIKFRACEQLSQNSQVKQYAQQILPKLESHLNHSQQAAVALGLPSNVPGEAVPAGSRIEGTGGSSGSSSGMGGSSGSSNGMGGSSGGSRTNGAGSNSR